MYFTLESDIGRRDVYGDIHRVNTPIKQNQIFIVKNNTYFNPYTSKRLDKSIENLYYLKQTSLPKNIRVQIPDGTNQKYNMTKELSTEIYKKYYNKITRNVPTTKSFEKPFAIILSGRSGAGKTSSLPYIRRRLGIPETLKLPIIDGDDIYSLAKPYKNSIYNTHDGYKIQHTQIQQDIAGTIKHIEWKAWTQLIEQGTSHVLNIWGLNKWHILDYKNKFNLIIVYVSLPSRVARTRVEMRSQKSNEIYMNSTNIGNMANKDVKRKLPHVLNNNGTIMYKMIPSKNVRIQPISVYIFDASKQNDEKLKPIGYLNKVKH